MGRIVKQVSDSVTKYYWYPGEKTDWIRTAIALGSGAAVALVVGLLTRSGLWAAVLGTSVTAAVAGVHLGRKDTIALQNFPDFMEARRAAVADTGKQMWRALVKGFSIAAAAVLVVNMPSEGFVYDWVLPVVPAIVGTLAHQLGMIYERMAQMPSTMPDAKARTPKARQLEVAGSASS